MNRGHSLALFLVAASAMSRAVPTWAIEPSTKDQESFRYNAHGRRDPFVLLVRDGRLVGGVQNMRGGDGSTLVLHGIVWDAGGHSIALIDDTEARVGDTIGEYRVQEIRQDAVVLTNGGEPVVLRIAFEAPPSEPPSGTTTGGELQ